MNRALKVLLFIILLQPTVFAAAFLLMVLARVMVELESTPAATPAPVARPVKRRAIAVQPIPDLSWRLESPERPRLRRRPAAAETSARP
jgi:hypothetical protein